ncbi:MAG TPA: carboxypeptidase-like regulatory domain-containing protein [Thermoanaerobaculia bacterium]|nr:carboxypeptidase-like regulatory domain-containing protein [Thermoanaerobaculia bacterium]
MRTRSERRDRLAIASPCQESWQAMGGDERTRFCSRCQKHVHDLAALEAREIDALIEATQGRFCARITRDRFGRMVTREPDVPPFHRTTLSVRRSSPAVAAVVAAAVGLTGAGWAQAPVSTHVAALVAGNLAAPDPAHPAGPGGAVLGGRVVDRQGASLPGAGVTLRHHEEGWRFIAVTDAEGRFQFRDLPSGVYDVEAELEGFDFETAAGVELGPEGRLITITGAMSETDRITVTMGEVWMPVALPLDTVLRESHVMVAGIAGPSVKLRDLGAGLVHEMRTELRITSVLKGKPRSETLQINRYFIQGQSETVVPGDVVLALLDPLGPGDGRPDSLVYLSADPIHALRLLPADPRLRPELGVDEAGWRAMSYIASATHNGALQELVTGAILQVEAARRQFAAGRRDTAGEKRLRARTAAIDEELRHRFVQVLSGGG